ncbi:sensor histidine kinase [Glaciibacter flavus]|nr:histidine kinase [Glaciibacter flavus]
MVDWGVEQPEAARSGWRRTRRWRPSTADAALALVYAVALAPLTFFEVFGSAARWPWWSAVVVVAFLVLHGSVAARRTYARTAFVVASVVMLALATASLPGLPSFAVLLPSSAVYLVILYTASAGGDRVLDLAAVVVGLVGACLIAVIGLLRGVADPQPLVVLTGFVLASVGAAWVLGRYQRESRRTAAARRLAQAQALELEMQRERERIAQERRRIGRDVHDVVAHSLAVMLAQAEATRVLLGRDDDRARESLDSALAVGRSAMVDMRGMLGVFDDAGEPAPLKPGPRLADVARLVENSSSPGRTASLVEVGEERECSAAVHAAAVRIVQESLTNTLKHTHPPTRTEVRVEWGPDLLVIEVSDDGRGHVAEPGVAGRGIRGMRERAEQAGDGFRSGPREDGSAGWTTCVRFPLGPDSRSTTRSPRVYG